MPEPELPPPPAGPAPPWTLADVASWVRSSPRWAVVGGAVAAVVVGAVAWAAFLGPSAGGGPPVELTLPRADATSTTFGAGGSAAPTGEAVVVHVAGAVVAPGLYRLGGDARVADALDAAGGPAADADLDTLNLAARVADGERVYVARRGEVPPAVVGTEAAGAAPAGPIDLNTATAEQLEALPGVGPATVEAILSYRKEKGRFRSVDELLEVRGIGEAKLASLRSKVTVR